MLYACDVWVGIICSASLVKANEDLFGGSVGSAAEQVCCSAASSAASSFLLPLLLHYQLPILLPQLLLHPQLLLFLLHLLLPHQCFFVCCICCTAREPVGCAGFA